MLETDQSSEKTSYQVWVECNENSALIANLNSRKLTQMRLDLAFGIGDVVTFAVKGDDIAVVHLSGYYLAEYDEDFIESKMEKKDQLSMIKEQLSSSSEPTTSKKQAEQRNALTHVSDEGTSLDQTSVRPNPTIVSVTMQLLFEYIFSLNFVAV